jgi:AraC-like DNA-binding protein
VSGHATPALFNLLRIGAATVIPMLLEEQGISAQTVFASAGFGSWQHLRLRPIVPLIRLGQLFKAAATATAQPEFGLLVGLRAGSHVWAGSQPQAHSPPRVGASLMRIMSETQVFPNALLTLNVSGGTCMIGCVALPGNVVAHDQLADCAMGFTTAALRNLCGPRWRPTHFHFMHQAPADPSRHVALLQAPVSFEASLTAMAFESSWLDRDLVDRYGEAHGRGGQKRTHQSLVEEVRAALASWEGVGSPAVPKIASAVGLPPRALNRLLSKAGTNLSRIREEMSYDAARRILRDPAVPVASVAWSLGYTDASTFSRAFRRWSGMTPSKWRKTVASKDSCG